MDAWRKHFRREPVRALLVACLLAGVFAMQGLTGSHDAAMALAHRTPVAGATEYMAPAKASTSHRELELPEVARAMSAAKTVHRHAGFIESSDSAPRSELTVQAGDDGHLHAMGDVCLAMLAALLLALMVTLALRSRALAHPAVVANAARRVTADGPSPPWRRPTLSKLCVLRT